MLTFIAAINILAMGVAFYRLRQPTNFFFWMVKVFVSAFSPVLLVVGLITVICAVFLSATAILILGSISAILCLAFIVITSWATNPATGFAQAYGPDWESDISEKRKDRMLSQRYVVKLPKPPVPVVEKDITYYTVEGSGREVRCDIWQPPKEVQRSGLAFIYLHGSAWTVWDKGTGTKTMFSHLAAQGHTIMDLGYRLYPETDMMGMVHDTKYAIAWLKARARRYKIDPNRLVIGGGSAGGHIALLTAYTSKHELFTPAVLAEADLSVRGVVSLYGPTDLRSTYYHCAQHLVKAKSTATEEQAEEMPAWLIQWMGDKYHRLGFDKQIEPGMLAPMLGGGPDDIPKTYDLFSPISHVGRHCPDTLLLQGEHDIIVSARAAYELHQKLNEVGVPAVTHIIPLADHAFDLILPKISPPAQHAWYDLERFLALMAERKTEKRDEVALNHEQF